MIASGVSGIQYNTMHNPRVGGLGVSRHFKYVLNRILVRMLVNAEHVVAQ